MVIQKEILREIWNWLEEQITPEDRELLKKYMPGIWEEFSKEGIPILDNSPILWRRYFAATLYDLSLRIQEILDAKKNRKEIKHCFGDGLPRQYIIELAQLLGLEVSGKRPKGQILAEVIMKIKEENQQES